MPLSSGREGAHGRGRRRGCSGGLSGLRGRAAAATAARKSRKVEVKGSEKPPPLRLPSSQAPD
eukprot:2515064-Pyramimonas_sp.AAC.1